MEEHGRLEKRNKSSCLDLIGHMPIAYCALARVHIELKRVPGSQTAHPKIKFAIIREAQSLHIKQKLKFLR